MYQLGRSPPSASLSQRRGRTALHVAAESGHGAVVEQLIADGAKVNTKDISGHGPGRVFGSSGGGCWRGDGRGSWGSCISACFGMLNGTGCLKIHFCAGMDHDGHLEIE